MQNPLSRYVMLTRRWAWLVILGIVICSGTTYFASILTRPVYQASATLVISLDTASSSSTTASLAAVPTYAQLLTNPAVLKPVVAQHPGMTLQQLSSMITVKSQSNTLLIELDVQHTNPQVAAQLANEISKSFALYADAQLPGNVQILPAQTPSDPVRPKPLQDAGMAAVVSLGLAITLIIVFEWLDDRLSHPEEVAALGMELLTSIPLLLEKRKRNKAKASPPPTEKYHKLCVRLNAAKAQDGFKLVMVTSALPGEGKSTVAANLASSLALTGKKVLLVDANLRTPTQDHYFRVSNARGFSHAFLGRPTLAAIDLSGQETSIPNLRVLTSGRIPSRPAELLQSPLAVSLFDYFRSAPFDYVIFDAPSVLPFADAQIMASLVQTVIFVFDAHKTSRRALLRAKEELDKSAAPLLGIVLNKSRWPDYEDTPQATPHQPDPRNSSPMITSVAAPTSHMLTTSTITTLILPALSSKHPRPLKLPTIPSSAEERRGIASPQQAPRLTTQQQLPQRDMQSR